MYQRWVILQGIAQPQNVQIEFQEKKHAKTNVSTY